MIGRTVRVAALLVTALLALAVAACARTGAQAGTDPKARDAITRQIRADLSQLSDVTSADVRYQDTLTAPGTVSVTVMVRPGGDVDAVVDRALRLVWTSRLNPLHAIRIDVTDPGDQARSVTKIVRPGQAADRAEMDGRYGPRPTG